MEKQKKTINTLYFILILSTILSFVPESIAQTVSLVLVIVVLIAAYMYRSKDSQDGLLYNHMTYMIGTIWIGTGFIVLGSLITGLWVYLQGDQSVILNAISQIETGIVPSEAQMEGYVSDYIDSNKALLMKASLVAIGPAILYFVYRVGNGIGRASKGYRIANPKSWL